MGTKPAREPTFEKAMPGEHSSPTASAEIHGGGGDRIRSGVRMRQFPYISDERRMEMLAPQPGRVRVLIDTDAANEVDDQFAITWGLLSPDRLDIEAIVAAPFSRAYFREPLLAAARADARRLERWRGSTISPPGCTG